VTVAQRVAICARADASSFDWARLSARWRAELDDRMAQLKKLRDTLDDCIGCGCLSIDPCRLRNPAPGPQRLWLRQEQVG
jgi:MerR family redox-sensitive transcriptional activator SoxR